MEARCTCVNDAIRNENIRFIESAHFSLRLAFFSFFVETNAGAQVRAQVFGRDDHE